MALPQATEDLWYPSLLDRFLSIKAMAAASADEWTRTLGVDMDLLILAVLRVEPLPRLDPGDVGFPLDVPFEWAGSGGGPGILVGMLDACEGHGLAVDGTMTACCPCPCPSIGPSSR